MDFVARNPGAVGSEIGRSPIRLMARRAVEGRGKYVDDLVLPRMVVSPMSGVRMHMQIFLRLTHPLQRHFPVLLPS